MKKSILLFLLCLCGINQAQVKFKVELAFKYIKPNCAQGKANAKVQEELKKEVPLANQKFYVYKDNKLVDSLKTNDSGKVFVKYYPGTYLLFEPWKHFKKTPDGSSMTDFFKDCLVKEWTKPNYKLTIVEGDFKMEYYEVSASRCPNQYACLKVRHLPNEIKRK